MSAAAALVMLLLVTRGRPWALFSEGDFSADFYDEQARAFTAGRLDIDPAVASIEGFVVGDETHFYFGIMLAVLRVPVLVFTDSLMGQLTALSILVAYVLLLVAGARLARSVRELVRRDDTPSPPADSWRLGLFLVALAGSPALFAGGWLTVYHETEIWALTFGVIALAAAIDAYSNVRLAPAIVAAVGASAAVLTRVSVGLAIAAAVAVALALAPWPRRRDLAGPLGVIGAGVAVHVGVNWARFGHLFSVPFHDQQMSRLEPERAEWLAANGDSLFSPAFVPATLVQYLRPDAVRFERLLPFVRYGPSAEPWGDLPFESNTPSSSLTVTATLLCILSILGAVWLVRQRRWGLAVVAVITALGAVPTFAIGFVANRYLIDLLPPLVLLGAFGCWVHVSRARAAAAVGVLLGLWGIHANIALALWTGSFDEPSFTRMRYTADKVLPAPSPGLVTLGGEHELERFGTVAVDVRGGQCQGVYVASWDQWLQLERPGGFRRATGTVGRSDVEHVETPGGTVEVDGRGVLQYHTGDGTFTLIDLDLDPQPRLDSGTRRDPEPGTPDDLRYEVVVDPVTDDRFVRFGDDFAFLPADVLELDGRLVDDDRGDDGELCSLLMERMGDDGESR